MHDSKLIMVLKKLSPLEMKRFSEYLQSPFFRIGTDVYNLLSYIQTYIGNWEHENLSKEKAFGHLFPALQYDNKKINKIISNALDTVEHFYCLLNMNPQQIYFKEPLFEFYHKYQLDTHYTALCRNTLSHFEQKEVKDGLYLQQVWLYYDIVEIHKTRKYNRNKIEKRADIVHFEVFAITRQLMYLCDYAAREYIFNESFSLPLGEALILFLKKNPMYLQSPTIELYYFLYLLLKKNLQYWDKVLAILPQAPISNWEKNNCYGILQNVCLKVGGISAGGNTDAELMPLYRQQVQEGCYTDANGNVAPAFFKNVVTISLRLKEFDWCLAFMNESEPKLPEDRRYETATLCKALWYFEQQLYSDTLKLLFVVDTEDTFFNIAKRILEIRTYYELGELDTTLDFLNSLLVYVHRQDKLDKDRKAGPQNFANILKSIINTSKKHLLTRLSDKIDNTTYLSEKKWLKKQIQTKINA